MELLDEMQRHIVYRWAARDGGLVVWVAFPMDPHLGQPGLAGTELEVAVHRDTSYGAHEQTVYIPRGTWHCASLHGLPNPSLGNAAQPWLVARIVNTRASIANC
jgi:hypothetical protein